MQKDFKKTFLLPILIAVFGLGLFAFSGEAQAEKFFQTHSTWYEKIPSNPAITPNSANYINDLAYEAKDWKHWFGVASSEWGVSVWYADSNTPLTTVKFMEGYGYDDRWAIVEANRWNVDIPIPVGAKSSGMDSWCAGIHRDLHMIVISADRKSAWDFYKTFNCPVGTTPNKGVADGTWYAQIIRKWDLTTDGLPLVNPDAEHPFGHYDLQNKARQAPVALPHTIFTYDEMVAAIAAGNKSLTHALAMGYSRGAGGWGVYPGVFQSSDGNRVWNLKIGMRLQLDPNEDCTAYGLTDFGEVICNTLQTYGIIFVESTGPDSDVIFAEDLIAKNKSWSSLNKSPYLNPIPLDKLRVIEPLTPPFSSQPQTYYIDDSGDRSDSYDGSINKPWATFAYAMTRLQPGDTLLLKDGTYTESLNITVSGTEGNPITIQGINDDADSYRTDVPIIDGEGVRWPCAIIDSGYINLEGVSCKNSSGSVVKVTRSDYVNIRRVSGYNAGAGNEHVFSGYQADHILFEDTIAWGTGRKMYEFQTVTNSIIRRVWGQWKQYVPIPPSSAYIDALAGLDLYNSANNIVENNIMTNIQTDANQNAFAFGIQTNGTAAPSNNSFYGNVGYNYPRASLINLWGSINYSNTYYDNNVGFNNKAGLVINAGTTHAANHFTIVGTFGTIYGAVSCDEKNGVDTGLNVKNSVILNNVRGIWKKTGYCDSFLSTYNDLYNNTSNYYGASQGIGEIFTHPNYSTATYGNGAYLIKPSNLATSGEGETYMGAEVLYRYENGQLTDTPLWQNDNNNDGIYEDGWPMEDRICAETGFSATYENGCSKGGGLWKTLEGVYDTSPNPTTYNLQNFKTLLSQWFQPSGSADINGDNIVNARDLGIMMSNWSD